MLGNAPASDICRVVRQASESLCPAADEGGTTTQRPGILHVCGSFMELRSLSEGPDNEDFSYWSLYSRPLPNLYGHLPGLS